MARSVERYRHAFLVVLDHRDHERRSTASRPSARASSFRWMPCSPRTPGNPTTRHRERRLHARLRHHGNARVGGERRVARDGQLRRCRRHLRRRNHQRARVHRRSRRSELPVRDGQQRRLARGLTARRHRRRRAMTIGATLTVGRGGGAKDIDASNNSANQTISTSTAPTAPSALAASVRGQRDQPDLAGQQRERRRLPRGTPHRHGGVRADCDHGRKRHLLFRQHGRDRHRVRLSRRVVRSGRYVVAVGHRERTDHRTARFAGRRRRWWRRIVRRRTRTVAAARCSRCDAAAARGMTLVARRFRRC